MTVVRTEHLVLRPLPAVAAGELAAGRAVGDLVPAADWPTGDDRGLLELLALSAATGPTGTWLVELDGQVVGSAGAKGAPDALGDLEISYALAPAARGRGLGTEAVAGLCAVLETRPGVRTLVAQVLPGNAPSRRLLDRLGFVEEPGEPPLLRYVRSRVARPRLPGRHVC